MCGIAGALALRRDLPPPEGAAELFAAAMIHRGPDGHGFFRSGPVALAHRRLSIIDLSDAGRQPMTNEDGQIAIVVNGEIYNHAELRADLEAKGHRFRSASDSEVIAHLYEEVGARTPELLRGMFAFAVWDGRTGTLLLARDCFGEKPLFYGERPDGFVFASELAALLADERTPAALSLPALDAYLALQYVPSPDTIYEGLKKLPAGHTLELRCGERPVVRRYYRASFAPTLGHLSERAAAERVRAAVEESVRIRLMSDVPLGAFLSGGIDSSIVVACMARASGAPVKTFSVGFSEGGRTASELPYARLVAERYRTEHHEMVVEPDMVGLLPDIVRHHGEPFADTSAVPTRYLCELARRHVTVALSGDAGDEAFGGYRRYVWAHVANVILRLPPPLARGVARALGAVPGGRARWLREYADRLGADEATRYLRFICHFSAAEKGELYAPELRARFARDATAEAFAARLAASDAGDVVGRLQNLDAETYLPDDILAKVDVASMAHGLEARAPFVDHRVMELGAALPGHLKLRHGRGKRILKEAFADSGPPGDRQPPKEGLRAADRSLAGGTAARFRARAAAVARGPGTGSVRTGRGRGAARSPPGRRGSRRAALEPHGSRDVVSGDDGRAGRIRSPGQGQGRGHRRRGPGVMSAPPSKQEDAAHAARSGVSQIAAMLGQGLIPLHRMLVSRLFGQTAYGIYRAGADLCEVSLRAGMAGADKAMFRFVAGHRAAGETAEETRALGSGLRLAGGLSLLLALGLMLAAPLFAHIWRKPDYRTVLPILAPSIFAGGGVIVLMAATLAARVTRINLLVRGIAEPVLLVVATLVAFVLRPTVVGVAVAHVSTYAILLVLAWFGAGVVFGPGRLGAALRAPPAPGFVRFAIPVGASELLNGILQRVNVFILSGFSGAAAVAVLAASEELGRSAAGIRYAFDSIASPMMSEALKRHDRERLRYNLALMTRWVASASAPIAATLLALRPELLSLYGPGYAPGEVAMTLFVLGHLVNGVLGLTPYVIVMSGRSRLFFWNNLGAAVLNLALAFLLIPRHGVTGAAVASLVSVVTLQLAFCVQVYRLERVHPFDRAFAKPFLAAAVAFAAELAVKSLPVPTFARVALVIAVGAVTYAAALLALKPGEEERRFIMKILRRLTGEGRRA